MRGKIRKEKKDQRAKTPGVNRTRKKVGDFGTQNDWVGIEMNQKKQIGDIPQYQLNKEPSVTQRGLLQSKLSATAVKDTKYNEVTVACLNKFHPDDPRDVEDFFENEENKEIANYNVEGYKYREYRHAINLIREAGLDPNKSRAGKKNNPIRRLSIQDSMMTGNTPTYFDR